MSEKYDCITFHTSACDEHLERLLNVHGSEGLDDVCPLCEISRLTAEVESLKKQREGVAGGASDALRKASVEIESLRTERDALRDENRRLKDTMRNTESGTVARLRAALQWYSTAEPIELYRDFEIEEYQSRAKAALKTTEG